MYIFIYMVLKRENTKNFAQIINCAYLYVACAPDAVYSNSGASTDSFESFIRPSRVNVNNDPRSYTRRSRLAILSKKLFRSVSSQWKWRGTWEIGVLCNILLHYKGGSWCRCDYSNLLFPSPVLLLCVLKFHKRCTSAYASHVSFYCVRASMTSLFIF